MAIERERSAVLKLLAHEILELVKLGGLLHLNVNA